MGQLVRVMLTPVEKGCLSRLMTPLLLLLGHFSLQNEVYGKDFYYNMILETDGLSQCSSLRDDAIELGCRWVCALTEGSFSTGSR